MENVFEELNKLYNEPAGNTETNLQEKWFKGDETWQKMWWSDSEYEFRNLLKTLAASKRGKGYRLVVGDGTYAVASAMDLNHDGLAEMLMDNYLPVGNEQYIIGIPTIADFDEDNFEIQDLYDTDYLSFGERDFSTWDIDTPAPDGLSKEEFFNWFNANQPPKTPDPELSIAVCDGFEVDLYNLGRHKITEERFKNSALYRALGNLFKYIK